MILLYASPHEVKYVDCEPKICIGVGAKYLGQIFKDTDLAVLFGSCGSYPFMNYKNFVIPSRFYYRDKSIDINHRLTTGYYGRTVDKSFKGNVKYLPFSAVFDMESYHVAKFCQERNIPFVSIRYIIDFHGKRVMPRGFNYFWREFQHKRMQRKFNKLLETL